MNKNLSGDFVLWTSINAVKQILKRTSDSYIFPHPICGIVFRVVKISIFIFVWTRPCPFTKAIS